MGSGSRPLDAPSPAAATLKQFCSAGRENLPARRCRFVLSSTDQLIPTDSLSALTDPLALKTSFTYDADGRLLTTTLPDSRAIGYSHDANGIQERIAAGTTKEPNANLLGTCL